MTNPKLTIISGLLLAIGISSTSIHAEIVTDPEFQAGEAFYAGTSADTSSGIVLTGGTYTHSPSINAGGLNTANITDTSFTIDGKKGTSTFKNFLTLRGGSLFKESKTASTNRHELIIKDAIFEGDGTILVAGNQNNASNTKIDVNETYLHLTDVESKNYLYVIGGNRTYYNQNTTINLNNSSVILEGSETSVPFVVGGNMINGNLSQNGSWVNLGNSYVEIGKGVQITDMVVGANYIQWFGNAKLTGNSTVVVDGANVTNTVVGGNFVEYTYEGTLIPGAEGSTAPRQALSEAGSVSTVLVKNGSTVNDVVGGGYIIRDGTNDTEIELQSEAANVKVVIEDSTVKGNVVGAGMKESSTGVGKVDAKESVSVEIKNSTIAGIITSGNLDVSQADNPVVDNISAPADKVEMKLTNVNADGSVIATKGTVELRAEDNGTTNVQLLQVDEGVVVSLTANGVANDAAGGDVTKAISVKNGTFDATINLEEGFAVGAVTGKIVDGKVDQTSISEKTNSVMKSALELASALPSTVTRILTNDVRKRMGDLRSAEGTSGAWVRYDGGKLSGESGLDTDFHTIQLGFDTVPAPDSARFGIAFSYTDGDADQLRTQSDLSAFSLAGYGTWMSDNGLFVDGILRMAKVENDISVDGLYDGTVDNVVLSGSVETGWRFDLNDLVYVEPQAEVMYTYVDGDKFDIGPAQYAIDSTDSLTGRLGFASGIKCPNDKGDLYVRASVVHEFLGGARITGHSSGTTRTYNLDGKDTWVEYGFGGNLNLTTDIEQTSSGI